MKLIGILLAVLLVLYFINKRLMGVGTMLIGALALTTSPPIAAIMIVVGLFITFRG